jgi:hypothetical protein
MQRRRTLVGMPVPVLCRPAVAARAGWGIAGMFAHDCGSGAQPRLLPRINGLVKTAQGSKHPQLSSLMSHLADAFPRVKIYAATCRSSCGSCSLLQCCGAPADEKGHPDRVAMHASQGGGDSLLGRTGLLGDTGTCARRRAVACHLENLLDRLDHLFGAAVMHHVAGIRPDVQL